MPLCGSTCSRGAGAELEPGRFLNGRDPFGNLIQVVPYDQIQFTKSPGGAARDGARTNEDRRRAGGAARQGHFVS